MRTECGNRRLKLAEKKQYALSTLFEERHFLQKNWIKKLCRKEKSRKTRHSTYPANIDFRWLYGFSRGNRIENFRDYLKACGSERIEIVLHRVKKPPRFRKRVFQCGLFGFSKR